MSGERYRLIWASSYWSACTKPGKWEVMYLCVRGTNFAFFYYFLLDFGADSDFWQQDIIWCIIYIICSSPHIELCCVFCQFFSIVNHLSGVMVSIWDVILRKAQLFVISLDGVQRNLLQFRCNSIFVKGSLWSYGS